MSNFILVSCVTLIVKINLMLDLNLFSNNLKSDKS